MNSILNRDIRKERDEQDAIMRQEIFKNFTVDSLLEQFTSALRDAYFDGVIPRSDSYQLEIITPYGSIAKSVSRVYLQDNDFKNEIDSYVNDNIQELLDVVNSQTPGNVELFESQLRLRSGIPERVHGFIIHHCDELFLFGNN